MTITDYISEIEFAATNVISVIWSEQTRIAQLSGEIERTRDVVEQTYQRAIAFQESDDADDVMLGVGIYFDNYFGNDKEVFHKTAEVQKLANQLASHKFSISSLSGSLLQFAKQGISIAHGELCDCPIGRTIGTQSLSDIIWQSRNQAIHWEDGVLKPEVEQCFRTLARDFDPKFNGYRSRSLAFEVIQLLGWTDYTRFKADLLSLQ
jgi:hypothetical protein